MTARDREIETALQACSCIHLGGGGVSIQIHSILSISLSLTQSSASLAPPAARRSTYTTPTHRTDEVAAISSVHKAACV